jgi:hypothetical protein
VRQNVTFAHWQSTPQACKKLFSVERDLLCRLAVMLVFKRTRQLNRGVFKMSSKSLIAVSVFLSTFIFVNSAYSDNESVAQQMATTTTTQAVQPVVQPYRTFITFKRYYVKSTDQAVSNVRLEILFPNGVKTQLPENGQYWPVGVGQAQDINRTFELPFATIQKDSFHFKVQMVRHGGNILPCEFEVDSLSQFNRSYICHTDVNWQTNQKVASEKIDDEGVEIRIFTDKNSQPKEIPQDTIALRP